ncbi:hypothetical protein UA08_05647 [Talaromyces atroroseus]|uniref:KOW domain-containing protein n=1 Tax=Talaromyces atroroseus TaxID=1441469 RepID=A0A225ALB7_TALAT|nr:hypothetical protein UA08_05647 [Talaromyces atroroseus]OKL59114.1 hypothetical protein UA08_05647 [Talaromyces atroroseus]
MQRLIRRTTLAKNQAARKARIQEKKERRLDFMDSLRERTALNRTTIDNIREEKARRREDWFKGPLAPNRDSGLTAGAYGTITPQDRVLPTVPKHLRRRFVNIAQGDRVCLLKGPDAGRICEVSSVDIERESLTVQHFNTVDVRYPAWANQADGSQDPFLPQEMPISIDDVRLVVTLEDQGRQYEVIAKHVYGGGPYLKRSNAQTPRHTRYITGENIRIPWPEETKVDNAVDEDGDTSRKEVEYETWKPSIQQPPFSQFILDELRNKFSKYRTRHDPMWLENRKLEDLREEYRKSRKLLTPRGEHRERLAKQKEVMRQSKLDENGNYIMDATTSEFIAQFIGRQGGSAASQKAEAKQ